MLLLGAHLSIAGGFDKAVALANRLKCNCFQVFVKNQRQWRFHALTDEQIRAWHEALASSRQKIERIVAHSGYLINLASDSAAVRRKSIRALQGELRRCRTLGIDQLVLHPGSHRGQGREKGRALVSKALDKVFTEDDSSTRILLETTSGAGFCLGDRFEDIAALIAACRFSDRLGCCLDTCHMFAAGYDFSTREAFDDVLARIDRLLGLDRIGCIHVNDSRGGLGSRLDRHEHIGRGKIGLDAFRFFMTAPKLSAIPKLLETPKGKDLRNDRRNLRLLRQLAGETA